MPEMDQHRRLDLASSCVGLCRIHPAIRASAAGVLQGNRTATIRIRTRPRPRIRPAITQPPDFTSDGTLSRGYFSVPAPARQRDRVPTDRNNDPLSPRRAGPRFAPPLASSKPRARSRPPPPRRPDRPSEFRAEALAKTSRGFPTSDKSTCAALLDRRRASRSTAAGYCRASLCVACVRSTLPAPPIKRTGA